MASSRAAYLALLPALMVGAAALSQSRPIPEDARRGYLRHVEGMTVTVDDKAMRLAAGATIRNRQNLIIVPVSLPGSGAWADYVLDRDGQIFSVWLLTPEELGRARSPTR
ncbi:MAG: hypothetical protein WBO23_14555 [Burkholderiales bacterium]